MESRHAFDRKLPAMKAVMTSFPYFIDIRASLREARDMLRAHEIRHLPVKSRGELIGVISDRDIRRALESEPDPEPVVEHVVLRDPYVVSLNERLDTVLLELARRHIDCALVVREGRLAGIFTTTDACRVFGEYLRIRFPLDDDGDAA